MTNELSISQRFRQGSGSVGTVLAVLVAVLIGYLTFKVQDIEKRLLKIEKNGVTAQQEPPKAVDIAEVKKLFNNKNIVLGDPKSKVLFVEFSDPSCPFCHVASGLNPEVSGDRFKTVALGGTYRPPVTEIRNLVEAGKAAFVVLYANGHGAGEMAAQALYCANEKGKYWDAHDLLYVNAGYTLINEQVKNDKSKAGEMAAYLSGAVDPAFMTECLSTAKYAKKLQADQAKAQELGFGGTPMFLVNGERFNGAYNFADMEATVTKFLQ